MFDKVGVRMQIDPKTPQQPVERLNDAREKATQDSTAHAREYPDRKAEPHHYVRDQLVLLQDPYNLNRNAKIAPRYTGAQLMLGSGSRS